MLERRVILINKNCYLLTGLFIGCENYTVETTCKRRVGSYCNVVSLLIPAEGKVKIRTNRCPRCSTTAHVKAYNRMFHPFLFQFHNLQPLKQVATPLKVGLQCVNKHRLAKPARTAKIVVLHAVDKIPYHLCLIDIQASAFSYLNERLHTYRKSSYDCCHISIAFVYIANLIIISHIGKFLWLNQGQEPVLLLRIAIKIKKHNTIHKTGKTIKKRIGSYELLPIYRCQHK